MYGEKIRQFRKQKGLNQQELGEMLGVSAVSVSKWERAQTQPDIETLRMMADLFNTTIDELCDHEPALVSPQENKLTMMARAFRQLTDEEQDKYLAVGRALFAHAFDDEEAAE